MLRGDLVHVAGLTDVALGVVEWTVGLFVFGVCAVPEFASVEGVRVDVVQQGFEAAHVLAGCEVAAADCSVPFVVYEAGAVAAEGDGDGHCLEVADACSEVGLLLVGERVPRVGERNHDGEVGGAGGEEVGCCCDLVDDDVGGEGVRHGACFFLVVLLAAVVAALFSFLVWFSYSTLPYVFARVTASVVGRERCGVCHACPVVRERRGLLVGARGGRVFDAVTPARLLACCGWVLVPPPFFVAAGVPLVCGAKGVGVGREFSFFFLRELGVWFLVAVKWHVNGEGKPGKCGAKKGQCPFGADTPHFGTKREAEAAAEALIARESSGFGGDGDAGVGVRDAFAADGAFVVDAAGRFYWRDGEVATCVSGVDVSRWDGSGDSIVDIVDGGGVYALNADSGLAHVLSDVNGGTVGGHFEAVGVYGCQLDEVTGDAALNNVGDYRRESASAPVSSVNVVSGNGSILRLSYGCRVGSVTDNGKVRDVYGGNIGEVSGRGCVNTVQDGGLVGSVVENGVVSNVYSGGRVERVSGRGVVENVKGGGSVDVVDGNGTVRGVARGGRVEYLLGASSLDANEGVVGFVGSPTAPAEGGYGASLADNRAGGRVECVRWRRGG